jgi:hypothetical protein
LADIGRLEHGEDLVAPIRCRSFGHHHPFQPGYRVPI